MRSASALALVLFLAALPSASGAVLSVSQSAWVVSGQDVMLRYTLPRSAAGKLAPPGVAAPTPKALGEYLLGHVQVRSSSGPCPAVDQGYDLGLVDPLYTGTDTYGFEILFRCPVPTGLSIRDAVLFSEVPQHMSLAQVRIASAPPVTRLLTSGNREVSIPDNGALAATGAATWFGLGAGHLLASLEDVCFVLALFLLARGRAEFGGIVVGTVLGSAGAVLLAAGGLLTLNTGAAGTWSGFLLVLAAALLIARQTGRDTIVSIGLAAGLSIVALLAVLTHQPEIATSLAGACLLAVGILRLSRHASLLPTLWVVPAALYGFLDGLTLPAEFAMTGARSPLTAGMLLAFNAGTVVALVALLAIFGAVAALVRRRTALLQAPLAKDLAAASLAGLGAYWLLA